MHHHRFIVLTALALIFVMPFTIFFRKPSLRSLLEPALAIVLLGFVLNWAI